jgi:rhodanese-related sulfurtransferase
MKAISLERLRSLIDAGGAQIVEVLPAEEYSELHLPGAVNLPLKKLDASTAGSMLDAGRPVVVYCWDSL